MRAKTFEAHVVFSSLKQIEQNLNHKRLKDNCNNFCIPFTFNVFWVVFRIAQSLNLVNESPKARLTEKMFPYMI